MGRQEPNLKFSVECCPACKSKNTMPVEGLNKLPVILFPVDKKAGKVETAPLYASVCNECGHIYQEKIDSKLSNLIYNKYYEYYPYNKLDSMQPVYRAPFMAKAKKYLPPGNFTLLEVGCENPEQMKFFLDLGYACSAINPGAKKHTQINFIDGFYGSTKVEGKFRFIISRFNLEHIADIESYFNGLNANLAPNGRVMIQVPNAEYYLSTGMLNIFAHEHTHYFNTESLKALITRNGYALDFLSDKSEPSIISVFSRRKIKGFQPNLNLSRASKTISALRRLIEKTEGFVFLYGAGLSITGLVYGAGVTPEIQKKIRLIDDNPVLWERHMPNTFMTVEPMNASEITKNSIIVLLLGVQYQNTVLKKIRKQKLLNNIYAVTSRGLSKIG